MSFFNHWFSGPPLESSRLPPQDTLKESYKKIEEIQNSAANFKVPTSEKLPWEQHGVFSYFDSPQEKLEWQIKKYKKLLGLDPLKDEWIRAPNNTLFKRTWGGLQNSAVKEQIEGHLASKLLDLEVNLKKMKKEKEFKEQFKEFLTGYAPDIEYEKCHWVKKPAKPLIQSIKRNGKNPRAFTSHVSTGQDDFFERSLVSKFPGSVGEFVRSEDDVKQKTSVFLKKLEMSIPKNDQEAALFYKYIVKGKTPNWDYFYYLPYIPPETSPNALDITSDKYVDLVENREPDMYDPSRKVTEDNLKKVSANTQQSTENLVEINQGVRSTNENLADLNDQVDDTNTELKSVSYGVNKLGKVIAEKNLKKKQKQLSFTPSPQSSPQLFAPPKGSPPPEKITTESTPLKGVTPPQPKAKSLKEKYNELMEIVEKGEITKDKETDLMSRFFDISEFLNDDEKNAFLDKMPSGEEVTEIPEILQPSPKPTPTTTQKIDIKKLLNEQSKISDSLDKVLTTKEWEELKNSFSDIQEHINQSVANKLFKDLFNHPTHLVNEEIEKLKTRTLSTKELDELDFRVADYADKLPLSLQEEYTDAFTLALKKTKETRISTPKKTPKKVVQEIMKTPKEKPKSVIDEVDPQDMINSREQQLLNVINMHMDRNFDSVDSQKKSALIEYKKFLNTIPGFREQDTDYGRFTSLVDNFSKAIDNRIEQTHSDYKKQLKEVRGDTEKLLKLINSPKKVELAFKKFKPDINTVIDEYNSYGTVRSNIPIKASDFDQMTIAFSGTHRLISENIKKKDFEKLTKNLLKLLDEKTVKSIDRQYVENTGVIFSKLLTDPVFKDYMAIFLAEKKKDLLRLGLEFQNKGYSFKLPRK